MQVESSAQSPRLHELSALPERVTYVLLRDPFDPSCERKLGRCHHLRMNACGLVDDVEKLLSTCPLGERATRKAPRTNLIPGDALQLAEPLPVDELAAREPRKRAAFENLEMHS